MSRRSGRRLRPSGPGHTGPTRHRISSGGSGGRISPARDPTIRAIRSLYGRRQKRSRACSDPWSAPTRSPSRRSRRTRTPNNWPAWARRTIRTSRPWACSTASIRQARRVTPRSRHRCSRYLSSNPSRRRDRANEEDHRWILRYRRPSGSPSPRFACTRVGRARLPGS